MLSTDLDAKEEVLEGYLGPLKIQLADPWMLAATLELPRTLNVAVADPGAVADLYRSGRGRVPAAAAGRELSAEPGQLDRFQSLDGRPECGFGFKAKR